jgi:hypothetical protein
MLAEFILAISISGLPKDMHYIGHFTSCEVANLYAELNYPDAADVRCLHEKFMVLPDNFKKKVIDIYERT